MAEQPPVTAFLCDDCTRKIATTSVYVRKVTGNDVACLHWGRKP
jgi:uncharacterized protein YlaI